MSFIIYLMSVVDSFKHLTLILGGLIIIASFIFFVAGLDSYSDEQTQKYWKVAKKQLLASLLCALSFTLTPSSKTIAAMVLVPKIAENKQLTQLPDKVLQVFNAKLDGWIDDLAKEKKEEK